MKYILTYNNDNFLYDKYLNIFSRVNGQISCSNFIACVYTVLEKEELKFTQEECSSVESFINYVLHYGLLTMRVSM